MITLKDSVKIHTNPKAIFDWFDNFDDNYTSWHPDHIKAKWIKGDHIEVNAIVYTEEYLGTHLEKLKFRITRMIPNRLIKFKVLFPESLICTSGSFEIKPQNGTSVFIATLSFRMGTLLAKIFPARMKALRKHMAEEGLNLKGILEGKS